MFQISIRVLVVLIGSLGTVQLSSSVYNYTSMGLMRFGFMGLEHNAAVVYSTCILKCIF